jgi:hypothetical protein
MIQVIPTIGQQFFQNSDLLLALIMNRLHEQLTQ